MRKILRKKLFFLIIFFACFFCFLNFTKNFGLGVSPDSVGYLTIAQNIHKRVGVFQVAVNWDTDTPYEPISIWPPLYPFVLAMFKVLGITIISGTRYLHAFLFSLNITLVVLFVYYVYKNIYKSLFSLVLLLMNYSLWYVHMHVWSEGIFILLTNLSIFFLYRYVTKGENKYLLLCGITASLTCLTRNMGLAVCLFCAISIFIFKKENKFSKIKKFALFITITCFPLFLWYVRNIFITGAPVSRKLIVTNNLVSSSTNFYYLSIFLNAKRFINGISLLFTSSFFSPYVRAIILFSFLCIIFYSFLSKRIKRQQKHLAVTSIFAVFIITYISILFLTSTFYYLEPIHIRYLSPLSIPLIMFLIFGGISIINNSNKKICIIFIALFLLIFYPWRDTKQFITNTVNSGLEYNSLKWNKSETINWIRNHQIKGTIYSNDPAAIVFLTEKNARWTLIRSDNYLSFKNKFDFTKDVIVWFDAYFFEYLLPIDWLVKFLDLNYQKRFKDGSIYYTEKYGALKS